MVMQHEKESQQDSLYQNGFPEAGSWLAPMDATFVTLENGEPGTVMFFSKKHDSSPFKEMRSRIKAEYEKKIGQAVVTSE